MKRSSSFYHIKTDFEHIDRDRAIKIACGKENVESVKRILDNYDTDFNEPETIGTATFTGLNYSKL